MSREKNLKLQNKDKIRLGLKEVPFIGHLISREGLKPDPTKVEAAVFMPKPTDVASVQRYIGYTYLSRFLSKLS